MDLLDSQHQLCKVLDAFFFFAGPSQRQRTEQIFSLAELVHGTEILFCVHDAVDSDNVWVGEFGQELHFLDHGR